MSSTSYRFQDDNAGLQVVATLTDDGLVFDAGFSDGTEVSFALPNWYWVELAVWLLDNAAKDERSQGWAYVFTADLKEGA